MFGFRHVLLGALVSLVLNPPARAATITIVKDSSGDQVIEISGRIEKGDVFKVKQVASKLMLSLPQDSVKGLHFHLNTVGGDIDEAMQIGRFFRDVLAGVDSYGTIIVAPGSDDERQLMKASEPSRNRDYVVVAPGVTLTEKHIVRNYSAGIMMFYGAVRRSIRDNVDRRLGVAKPETVPVMGIHRPYYDRTYFSQLSPSKAADVYKTLEKTVRSYLTEMGAPQALLDRMFASSSDRIELVPSAEFRAFYKPEESFLEEWLIAKCGMTGDYSKVLDARQIEDFRKMETWQIDARARGDKPIGSLYGDPSFPDAYVNEVYAKVRERNRLLDHCKAEAISTYQQDWARGFTKAASR
jgi:hypothetical protein